MKKLFSKILTIVIVILISTSSMTILPVIAANYQTSCFFSLNPYPYGVGQTVLISGFVSPSPSPNVYNSVYFKITAPSGASNTVGPFTTDTGGAVYTNFVATQAGSYSFVMWVETQSFGGNTYIGSSSPAIPISAVTVSPSSVTMGVGQSQTFTSSVSGGIAPFSYQWYLDGSLISGATSSTWTYTPSSAGSYSVYLVVTDALSSTATSNTASVTANPVPLIVLSPSSGTIGSSVTVTGSGFLPSSTVTITYGGVTVASTSTSVSGSFSALFSVPASTAGLHTVSAADGLANTATATFTVTPRIVLVPSSGTAGTSVLVSGTGFAASSLITLTFSGMAQSFSVTSSNVGSFSGSFTVPTFALGAYVVACSDPNSNVATATFTIVSGVLGVSISPSSVNMNVGQSQTFTSSLTPTVSLPYFYYWYLDGSLTSASGAIWNTSPMTWTYTSSSAGSHTVYLIAQDGVGQQATSNTASVTVNEMYFTITPSSIPGGSVNPGTQTVVYGGSQTFTFTPDAGYHITNVFVDGISVGAVSSYTFTNVQADHTIHVDFAVNTFVISPSAAAGGSITPSVPQTVSYGGSQAFSISANGGYHIEDVLVDGSSVGAVTSYTFSNVQADHTIAVTFAPSLYYLSLSVGGGQGTVSPSGVTGPYDFGTSIQISAIPATGWHFRYWWSSVDIPAIYDSTTTISMINSYEMGYSTNKIWRAVFDQDSYSLTLTTAGSGSIAKSPDQPNYLSGSTVQLTATAASGWTFAGWSGSITGTNNPVTVTMDAAKTITATFIQYISPPEGITYGGGAYDTATSIIKTNDGGYALAGYTKSFGAGDYDFWLIKTDSLGTMQWQQTYGGTGDDRAYDLVQTDDSGFALAGNTYSFGAGKSDFWLIKTDANGNMVWSNTYGTAGNEYASSLVLTNDGFAIVGGINGLDGGITMGSGDFWLVRTDENGIMVDNDIYGFPEGSGTGGEQAYSLVLTADGGFALTGYTNSFSSDGNRDIWLVKTLANGDIDWNQVFKKPSDDYGQVVIQTSDGGYAVAGYTLSIAGGYDMWLIKTDSSGTAQWDKTYGRQGWDFAMGLVQNDDGGYSIGGSTAEYYGASVYDFWLVITDAEGSELWSKTYGGNNDDSAWGLVSTGNNGFALVGFTRSFGWGNSGDAWLIMAYPPTRVLTFNVGDNGIIEANPDRAFYYLGEIVQIKATPYFGYYFTGWSGDVIGDELTISIVINADLEISATFEPMPAFTVANQNDLPPTDINYNIPALQPLPVQATWPDDKDGDEIWDLVAGKPMTVLVNLDLPTGTLAPNDRVTVTVTFEGNTYTKVCDASQLTSNGIIWFSPIIPQNIGESNSFITGTYQINSGSITEFPTQTQVTVRDTNPLPLTFTQVYRTSKSGAPVDYGKVTQAGFDNMNSKGTAFIAATYPTKSVTSVVASSGIAGTAYTSKYPFKGMQTDAIAAMNKRVGGTGVGVAIVPALNAIDYFTYHHQVVNGLLPAGVSFGPDCKGVLVLEGYYTSPAHEVAHTYGLYWPKPPGEQYQQPGYPDGYPASGLSTLDLQWRSGWSFMGGAYKETTSYSWVDQTTYKSLFEAFTQNLADPEVVTVSGIIYKDGNDGTPITFPVEWLHFDSGIPDQIVAGDYQLRFIAADGSTILLTTSFDASFSMTIDPAVYVGMPPASFEGFGRIETNTAAFAFTTIYPANTAKVEILQVSEDGVPIPEGPILLSTVYSSEIVDQDSAEASFTNPDYSPIDSFECVFTPSTGSTYKMSATNPGTFNYNLEITNHNPTKTYTITVQIPYDFVLKTLTPGGSPIEINGIPVTSPNYQFISGAAATPTTSEIPGVLTVSTTINQGQTITITVHLDYALKFQYGRPQDYKLTDQTTFARGYAFQTTINSLKTAPLNVAAVGKKVTAIGGFLIDVKGFPKNGLFVVAENSLGAEVARTKSSLDGFYFFNLQTAGNYKIKVYSVGEDGDLGESIGSSNLIKLSKDQFIQKDFNTLNPADPSVSGFVRDSSGKALPGIPVYLMNHAGKVVSSTTTNLGGYYIFRFYQPGDYKVSMTLPPGYAEASIETNVSVRQFESAIVNFELTRLG